MTYLTWPGKCLDCGTYVTLLVPRRDQDNQKSLAEVNRVCHIIACRRLGHIATMGRILDIRSNGQDLKVHHNGTTEEMKSCRAMCERLTNTTSRKKGFCNHQCKPTDAESTPRIVLYCSRMALDVVGWRRFVKKREAGVVPRRCSVLA